MTPPPLRHIRHVEDCLYWGFCITFSLTLHPAAVWAWAITFILVHNTIPRLWLAAATSTLTVGVVWMPTPAPSPAETD
jgi:hypothetical protein